MGSLQRILGELPCPCVGGHPHRSPQVRGRPGATRSGCQSCWWAVSPPVVPNLAGECSLPVVVTRAGDRKSTRLHSSHVKTSYAVFCLKKKKNNQTQSILKKKKKNKKKNQQYKIKN